MKNSGGGCLLETIGFALTLGFVLALLFGVTVGGKHYRLTFSEERGIEMKVTKEKP